MVFHYGNHEQPYGVTYQRDLPRIQPPFVQNQNLLSLSNHNPQNHPFTFLPNHYDQPPEMANPRSLRGQFGTAGQDPIKGGSDRKRVADEAFEGYSENIVYKEARLNTPRILSVLFYLKLCTNLTFSLFLRSQG